MDSLVEESEDEPEHEPPSTLPLYPTPPIGSRQEEDIEMDVTKLLYFWVSVLLLLVFIFCFSFCACH
jgi:hypothetical protein